MSDSVRISDPAKVRAGRMGGEARGNRYRLLKHSEASRMKAQYQAGWNEALRCLRTGVAQLPGGDELALSLQLMRLIDDLDSEPR